MIGIYKIVNKINGKTYVGQSIDCEERWKAHIQAANRGENNVLYKAMRKYGTENFEFEIIEPCVEFQLDNHEMFWIKVLNTLTPNGYNMTAGGAGAAGYHYTFTEQQKENQSKILTEYYKTHTHHSKGSKRPDEVKEKQRKSMIGKNKGKKQSEEQKEHTRQDRTGTQWWNNGIRQTQCRECPEGFVHGRLKKNIS